jgi:hypothetical protein
VRVGCADNMLSIGLLPVVFDKNVVEGSGKGWLGFGLVE